MKVKYLLIVSLMFAMVSQAEESATNTVKMVGILGTGPDGWCR